MDPARTSYLERVGGSLSNSSLQSMHKTDRDGETNAVRDLFGKDYIVWWACILHEQPTLKAASSQVDAFLAKGRNISSKLDRSAVFPFFSSFFEWVNFSSS